MLARNSMPVKSLTCAQASTPTPEASYLLAGSRTLGLFTSIRLILLTLRHNLTQELLAELFEISQSTVSRIINAYVPLIAETLRSRVPAVEDLNPAQQLNLRRHSLLAVLVLAAASRAVLG